MKTLCIIFERLLLAAIKENHYFIIIKIESFYHSGAATNHGAKSSFYQTPEKMSDKVEHIFDLPSFFSKVGKC